MNATFPTANPPSPSLSPELIQELHRLNPWWSGDKPPPQPEMERHLVSQIRRQMDSAIAPITVVRGPRQVGKTTAQLQIIEDLLDKGVQPNRILRVQFDELQSFDRKLADPILRIVEWFAANIAPQSLNTLARENQPAYLFFDEVQNLTGWDAQLKSLADHTAAKVAVTGSSALRIERGRDSLAGRISTIEAGVLSLTEICRLRGLAEMEPFLKDDGQKNLKAPEFWQELRQYGQKHAQVRQEAFKHFADRGGYPVTHSSQMQTQSWEDLATHLNETVIERVIQHDLRVGERGRKRDQELLEHVFRLACRYAGQTPAVATLAEEARTALSANIGDQRIRHYMQFLADTLLIRLIPPLEIRLKKKRGSPKICLVDHGLRASWLQEKIPLTSESKTEANSALAGHIAESIFGSVMSTIRGLPMAHYPARSGDPEVDFVLTVGDQRIPVEIKYRNQVEPKDTVGLVSFIDKPANRAEFGLLIVRGDDAEVDDERIVPMSLSSLMMLR